MLTIFVFLNYFSFILLEFIVNSSVVLFLVFVALLVDSRSYDCCLLLSIRRIVSLYTWLLKRLTLQNWLLPHHTLLLLQSAFISKIIQTSSSHFSFRTYSRIPTFHLHRRAFSYTLALGIPRGSPGIPIAIDPQQQRNSHSRSVFNTSETNVKQDVPNGKLDRMGNEICAARRPWLD